MNKADKATLHLFRGDCCCCDCRERKAGGALPARPMVNGRPTPHAPIRASEDTPFVPPIRLATLHPLDALLLSPHTRPPLPHAPLWDRGDGVTGALYADGPAGQEHPPRLLLGTPDATPPNVPDDLTTLPHLRGAERDPLLPYAAGIRDGRVYLRVHDLPAWVHHLRRADGTDWPDDGTHVWVRDRRLATDYRADEQADLRVTANEVDLDQPVIIGGEHASEDGRPLYLTRQVRPALAAGTWREVYGAQLTQQGASVTRHYLDGVTETEARTLPTVDVTVRVPDATIAPTLAYNRIIDGVGISNVGYAATVSITSGPSPRQRAGTLAYVAEIGSVTWGDPDPRPNFRLLIQGGAPEVLVTGIPGGLSDDKLAPLILGGRSVRARFIPDGDGLPLADARDAPPQALLTGALVYEGPLGTLPAPCSGVSATWAGLEVQASGHFTADAWVDAGSLWACLVDAGGQVQVARQTLNPPPGETAQVRRWTYPATAGLPGGTPVLTYSFLREGQAAPDGAPRWPTRAGLLAWITADGTLTRVSVRTRRGGDSGPGGQPVTFEVWPDLPATPDRREVTLTRPGTLAPPDAATLGGEPTPLLPRWRAPAPGEPGGTRPALTSVTGPLTLTWADPTGTGRARIAALTFLTSKAAAQTLGDRLTRPGGWTFETRPAGPFVRVTLTPPAPAPLSVTVLCQSLPVGHPRATLEATPDEN